MNCPIAGCPNTVKGPLHICHDHRRLIPRPQLDALAFYTRKRNGSRLHRDIFARAVESITKLLAARRKPARAVSMAYRDD